jgi:intracellular septation protein
MRSWFRQYPFNSEQTINVVGEIGPIFAMFVVNFLAGLEAGVLALMIATAMSLVSSLIILKRPPIMPFIAGSVSILFGALTYFTGDGMWVQIKVTIFNTLVAVLLWLGLKTNRNFFEFVFGKTFRFTPEGWYTLTRNAAVFFLVTAIANEAIRLSFSGTTVHALNRDFSGLDIWINFKLFVVMPLTGLFFWWQIKVMQKHRLPDVAPVPVPVPAKTS